MTSQMIEVKTAELEGVALDWAVAKAVSTDIYRRTGGMISDGEIVLMLGDHSGTWNPSTSWSRGGPLIEKFKISIVNEHQFEIMYACSEIEVGDCWHIGGSQSGCTYLTAACRAIVASKLGDTVSIPRELLP